MKTIQLTKGFVAVVSDRDFARVSKIKWYANENHNGVYARNTRYGYMHAFITGHEMTDHRNCNRLDNRRSNLRKADIQRNAQNMRKIRGTSKYKGVHLFRATGKWQAQIRVATLRIHLGYFNTEDDAARAYNRAARKHFGKFARLNEVSSCP